MAEYEEYQTYDEYYDEAPASNRTWLVVVIVVVVVLVCCCCLALVAGLALFGEDIFAELDNIASVVPVLDSMTTSA
jgi:hypothetical protein